MDERTSMLEIESDFFDFMKRESSHEVDPENVRFWFHTSNVGKFVHAALEDDHSAIQACPKSFGMRVGRTVFEFSPVPDSPNLYFFAGAFRVMSIEDVHPNSELSNCDYVHYEELEDYTKFKFRLCMSFERTNFNHYVRKHTSVLGQNGCKVLIGNPVVVSPPPDPCDIVDQSWNQLRLIAKNPSMAAWRTLLKNYNGLYVIRDSNLESQKSLYVGATFKSILHCWENDYVDNFGRAKVQLAVRPPEYIKKHFRWSVLRIFPQRTDIDKIHAAEARAKRMLGTGEETYGMNSN